MTDLATRIEQAEGPSRELDRYIHEAIGLPLTVWQDGGHSMPGYMTDAKVAPYTASINAAMTLVPEGFMVWALRQDETGWWCGLSADGGDVVKGCWRPAHSAAIALCAAALRAREVKSC